MATKARERVAVAAVLGATVLLVPAAGYGGFSAGRELRDESAVALPSAQPSPPATPAAPPSPSATAAPTELSREAGELAVSATVRLSPPSGYYLGSGSIVSSDGLILTNAHVAAVLPESDPGRLVVSTTTGDGAATPAYIADVLVVDGPLDLAVAKISAYVDGSPLPDDFDLPFVPLGSVADLTRGDDLTVYGYPGLNQGDRLTVREGVVGAFLPDRSGKVPGERHTIETDAAFSEGNSGGMALSNAGELVGVPSSLFTRGSATAHDLRAVDLAAPLLAAARSGSDYRSPYLTRTTGDESMEDPAWGQAYECSTPSADVLADSRSVSAGRVRLQGFAPGEDVLIVVSDDEGVRRVLAATADPDVGCLSVPVPAADEGRPPPAGYRLSVFAGPDRALVGESSSVVEEPPAR